MSCTRFGLIRHAPTRWNRQKRIQGIEDSPLTEDGRQLAKCWGKRLSAIAWDRILASELGRARQTAERINLALGVEITTTPDLREMDWGLWTGRTLRRIKSENKEQLSAMVQAGWQFCPPGGENRTALWQRSCQALKQAAQTWPGRTILVITHEGVIKALIYGLLGRSYLPGEPTILKSRYLHWLSSDGNDLSLEATNAMALNAVL